MHLGAIASDNDSLTAASSQACLPGLQKFRTGSRAVGGGFTQTGVDPKHAETAQTGLPDAVDSPEDLVEELLEAQGKVKPDALPLTRAATGSLLHVEVTVLLTTA